MRADKGLNIFYFFGPQQDSTCAIGVMWTRHIRKFLPGYGAVTTVGGMPNGCRQAS